ncbi:assimilatory nitrite reductase (NAD(P)H) large subunit precursor [Microbulbifer donghaiensis]|uniref:Assimilatory nitrite reductase (NAD(P)H) large subunit n=1 Tax=Microbulbifer donghaiensis TaxID=494016 RepID=A0A1M4YZV7_9GAMM|nr:nitrite reductase large subunit NirB [Microbulbifer donghaiensis]SHF11042.1 assimilatory nitrite reductase (NAD(P)H) large subunit precursor [Microbulbifer donghaiensis]
MTEPRVRQKLVVIGNGMVGHHFLEQLAAQAEREAFDVTVFAAEPRPAYDRVHLSEYFAGRSADDLALGTLEQYREWGFDLLLNDTAVEIDRENRTVISASGVARQYDRLILATGSYPFVPPIPGGEHEKCFVYRTIEDLDAIRAAASDARVGTVVGGGLLGLEAANALKQLGLQAHVVEFAPGLMSMQLDAGGAQLLQDKIQDLGVTVHTCTATEMIEEVDGRLRMRFKGDRELLTDLIVFSAGIRPEDNLARAAGLEIGERGGIVIDDSCRTSDANIFAIGECALYDNRIFGLVAPGYAMARNTVAQLCGDSASFTGADMSTKLKLLGVQVGSIGDAHGRTEGAAAITFVDEQNGVYKRMITDAHGKKLLGAVLVGDTEDYDQLLQYHLNAIDLPEHPEQLILPAANGAAPTLGAGALPATATICSCHNVSKGQVVDAVGGGCCSLAEVKDSTRASTGCGGCAALLKNVVDEELSALGVEVNNHLCAHFPFTRQELFHILQVEEIKTFAELLAKHGSGRGCEICKPTVASILASLWNEHIHKKPHVGLQDTNDTFMANMQKNGSYSVVPRVPGGEITPDRLIVLGQVAKKYNLYTKITGGQRIDLFGARLEQLPEIWRELIDAGFETGHAYGKSLRTVKSCVGSTWCRFGVQDSVAMALEIENRYKGLRSPHKIKMAVSGCTRECAEAQSKDVGVIATEKGWNLFVCGNGGMRPRHADLFATDIDSETLIKYIDRLLMFYVRTADKLQRTSVWLENLEGGLDYLREVIIDDKLGICAELEAQMANVVGTYQCEWKTAINDPDMLKRFRQFVNSDEADEKIVFVEERSQPRPARQEEIVRIAEPA